MCFLNSMAISTHSAEHNSTAHTCDSIPWDSMPSISCQALLRLALRCAQGRAYLMVCT